MLHRVRGWLAEAQEVRPDPAAARLAALLRDPDGLPFVLGFVDGVVRPEDPEVAVAALRRLAGDVPGFLTLPQRLALRAGAGVGRRAPRTVVTTARNVLRRMVGHLVVDAEDGRLPRALQQISAQGDRPNLNLLGEAVLGQREGARRLAGVRRLLARDDVDHVSVKVSAVVGPHSPWAHEETVAEVVDLLRPLYLDAARSPATKFINLDMEEYRDLDLTLDVFTRLLDEPALTSLEAGVVLQAYLPDAAAAMLRLQAWAATRRAGGGAAVKVRLVKGANLPMEQVDAELHGWPLATWSRKEQTDTQYKRILHQALTPERVRNVRLGVAGHNLFDVAFAWEVAGRRGVRDGVEFEMLLGMAPGQADAVRRTVGRLVVYTPVVHRDEFDVAIAYLVRRLDEASSEQNYLSALTTIGADEDLFVREQRRFERALAALDDEVPMPRRQQDRRREPDAGAATDAFANAPDTDPSLAANRAWGREVLRRARDSEAGRGVAEVVTDGEVLDELVGQTLRAGHGWAGRGAQERAAVLVRAADELERRRGELVEVMVSECGKTLDQADPEVSEAVDFARWYARCALELEQVDGARPVPVDLTVVTPPWNFPVAIPAGSALAALATGSAVVLKPAPDARRCAGVLVSALWAAGVPRDVLRLVDVDEDGLGRQLVGDPRVGRVLLTGAYATAELFLGFRPGLGLLAETSGKNSMVVTPSADLDLATKDVAQSAFGHAGQKCSAVSLVILVGSVGTSRRFLAQLTDAVSSLRVGPAWEAPTQMGPLTQPATGKLARALTSLDPGERWILRPRQLDEDCRLWTPGIKDGVRRGSWFHRVECFGPVLGIVRVDTLAEALAVQNEVDFGLTAGLHSLDDEEIRAWVAAAEAGNLYVNRSTTGAIVARQPFGGWKRSSVGPGFKSGGPHHLVGLVDWHSAPAHHGAPADALAERVLDQASRLVDSPVARASLQRALSSDVETWRSGMPTPRDLAGLSSEANVLRMLPVETCVRVRSGASPAEVLRVVAAGLRTGSLAWVSFEVGTVPAAASAGPTTGLVAALRELDVTVVREDSDAWLARLDSAGVTRVRAVGPPPAETGAELARADLAVHGQPVTESGRLELLWFLREQAVSLTAHRFGRQVDVLSLVGPAWGRGRRRRGHADPPGRRPARCR